MKNIGNFRIGIESIEIMDEFEEWNLLLRHYLMVLSCKGDVNLRLRDN